MTRKILLTTALIYANGDLHLGHLIEQIQGDIWARFQRLRGNTCYYICGSDVHGTPIMLMAQKLGKTPEAMVAEFQQRQLRDAQAFGVVFDAYGSTHDEENQSLVNAIYQKLQSNHLIYAKKIKQAFDAQKQIFLPDRFVKGGCPQCGAPDQYGDNCENCGATYLPLELKNPKSVLSDTAPIEKDSEHYFFDLPKFENFLKTWVSNKNHVSEAVANKMQEWFTAGLQAWDISRDAPYFGFKIPHTQDKYFYVWVDAPLGYFSIFKKFCETNQLSFEEFTQKNTSTEMHHLVGKDITYFHTLFWPAMLEGAALRSPSAVHVHGYLSINGQKMSKSRGTFITARQFLAYLPPEALRFYFAAKSTSGMEDIDLNLAEFRQKVNADIVGKVVNLASRAASFINKNFNNQLADALVDPKLFTHFMEMQPEIAKSYESRDFSKAVRLIMALADLANQFFDQAKPWVQIKQPETVIHAHRSCTQAINHFMQLMVYLKPIMPELVKKAEEFLKIAPLQWESVNKALLHHAVNLYQPLFQRIEESQIMNLEQAMQTENQKSTEEKNAEHVQEKLAKNYCSIEDFGKVELRVARILSAEEIPEADKLLKLQCDLGEEKPRQIFAGIKKSFAPEDLIGKLVIVVANLAPRKMRFGLSEGMVIVASGTDTGLFLVEPQNGAEPGMIVK